MKNNKTYGKLWFVEHKAKYKRWDKRFVRFVLVGHDEWLWMWWERIVF